VLGRELLVEAGGSFGKLRNQNQFLITICLRFGIAGVGDG
jgi:hypothetical protein